MKKICVVTSTRADYGILRPLIYKLSESVEYELRLVATGMHLCPEFGNTCNEIEQDGIPIHKRIDIQLSSDYPTAMSKSMGIALISFADYFMEHRPDLLILLGDRYEIAAICQVAVNECIPVAHIHGGEITVGAVDDCYRHAITKMSSLHFVSCEPYRRRVIQMGEQPKTVFNVGAMGVENILNTPLIPLLELESTLSFPLENVPYGVVTYHPVTMKNGAETEQFSELAAALDSFPDMRFIITKANSDAGGREINRLWEEYVRGKNNCLLVASLGMVKYLSCLKYAAVMIGNSSSGILEGPASKIPTVNIGNRQKGRITADSIINCPPDRHEIIKAIETAVSTEFRNLSKAVENPYGDGNTSQRIMEILSDLLGDTALLPIKTFYDIDYIEN